MGRAHGRIQSRREEESIGSSAPAPVEMHVSAVIIAVANESMANCHILTAIKHRATCLNLVYYDIIPSLLGYTMQEVVDQLHDEYGWSDSVSNLSGKLQRESLRYREAVELADVLGYDIVWQKRRD